MQNTTTLEYMTGFLMGIFLGIGLTAIILVIYNLFCSWRGCALIGFTWWNAIPLPLLLGISMAKIIAGLKLGDY
jgi:hypothetical protein